MKFISGLRCDGIRHQVTVLTLDGGELIRWVQGTSTGVLIIGRKYSIPCGEFVLACRYDGDLNFTELYREGTK